VYFIVLITTSVIALINFISRIKTFALWQRVENDTSYRFVGCRVSARLLDKPIGKFDGGDSYGLH